MSSIWYPASRLGNVARLCETSPSVTTRPRNWRSRRALRSGRRGEIGTVRRISAPIAATDDGLDDVGLTKLLAEAGNGHRHGVRERIGVFVLDGLQHRLRTDDHTLGHEQDLENGHLLLVQRDRPSASADSTSRRPAAHRRERREVASPGRACVSAWMRATSRKRGFAR